MSTESVVPAMLPVKDATAVPPSVVRVPSDAQFGFAAVLQITPLEVMAEPPLLVMVPLPVAVV